MSGEETGEREATYTVLVVDDDPMIADLYGMIIERLGHRAVIACSGEECLRLLEQEDPDLILLDILMEPQDGWMTLTEIRGGRGMQRVPIVMVTGKQLSPDEVRKYGMLIDGYVMKPFEMERLAEILDLVAGHQEERNAAYDRAIAAGADQETAGRFAELTVHLPVLHDLLDLLTRVQVSPRSEMMAGDLDSVRRYISEREEERDALAQQIGVAGPGDGEIPHRHNVYRS